MISSSNPSLRRIPEDRDSELILPGEKKIILPDVVLFGLAGVGKGTKAKLLSLFGYWHFEMGEHLRTIKNNDQTEIGDTVRYYMGRGEKVPDDIVRKVTAKEILDTDSHPLITLDGVVRSPKQKQSITELREQAKRDNGIIAVYLHAEREEVVRRMDQRIEEARRKGEEPRADDLDLEARERRLNIFFGETMDAVNEYKSEGLLITIDAMGPIEEVNEKFLNALGLQMRQTRTQVKDLMSA